MSERNDADLYARLGRLERLGAEHAAYWKTQMQTNLRREDQIEKLMGQMTTVNTTLKVATAILGFVLTVAQIIVPIVVPLVKG